MKRTPFLSSMILAALFSACQNSNTDPVPAEPNAEALFDYFHYQGDDDFYKQNPLKSDSAFYNPILPGFNADPTIVSNGKGDYYAATSTFTFFPGVPIFHSRDLVNWTKIGHILDRESQLENMMGQHVSGGIFAPALSYNPKTGTYYMITTNVGAGNFYVKTQDPAGQWSDPIHVPSIQGIDPSIFIDDDGKGYIVNNDDAPDNKPEYDGHRTVRIQELDLEKDECVGERKIIVNKGWRPADKPIWCEAPHIYKINGTYYLMTAEGGTGDWHSEVIYRSKSVWGPYEPFKGNPILTQRTLPADRVNPVTCAGHADLVQTQEGDWWAVFLGVRPVEDNYENLGRETFILPVEWTKDGWPMMTGSTELVNLMPERKGITRGENVTFGNYAANDEFDSDKLSLEWVALRKSPDSIACVSKYPGWLALKKAEEKASGRKQPALLMHRTGHHKYDASVRMRFKAQSNEDAAGIMLFKDENHHILLANVMRDGKQMMELQNIKGNFNPETKKMDVSAEVLDSKALDKQDVELRIVSKGTAFNFFFRTDGKDWIQMGGDVPAAQLSTRYAGGFTGTMIGLYCTGK